MFSVPNIYCLVKGAGEANSFLNAFDQALLNAGIGDTNLIRISSIVPPSSVERNLLSLPKGALVPTAYAQIESDTPGETIAAAIALGIPENPDEAGVIMEYEARESLQTVEEKVRQMTRDAFEYRNRKLKEIKSIGIEHTVRKIGSVFAAAVLWYE